MAQLERLPPLGLSTPLTAPHLKRRNTTLNTGGASRLDPPPQRIRRSETLVNYRINKSSNRPPGNQSPVSRLTANIIVTSYKLTGYTVATQSLAAVID